MKTSKGRKVVIISGVGLVLVVAILLWAGREKIRFLFEFESIGKNDQGYFEYRHRQTGIVFVSLPGGSFDMGSDRWEFTQPVHEVRFERGYFVGKFEVTRAPHRISIWSQASSRASMP